MLIGLIVVLGCALAVGGVLLARMLRAQLDLQ
jgi:hypothetical protein